MRYRGATILLPVLLLSAALAAPAWGQDLNDYVPRPEASTEPVPLTSAGFEQGADGWHLPEGYRIEPGVGRDGSVALAYERTDAALYPLARQGVDLEPGRSYRFSAWVKAENVEGRIRGATVCLEFYRGDKWLSGIYPEGVKGTRDWRQIRGTATIPSEADRCQIVLYLGRGVTGKAWFDDVLIEAEPPQWAACLLWPTHERLDPAGGKLLLGSFYPTAGTDVNEQDLACHLAIGQGDQTLRHTLRPIAVGRVEWDPGELPAGEAQLKLRLLDTRRKWILAEQTIPIEIAALPPPPAGAAAGKPAKGQAAFDVEGAFGRPMDELQKELGVLPVAAGELGNALTAKPEVVQPAFQGWIDTQRRLQEVKQSLTAPQLLAARMKESGVPTTPEEIENDRIQTQWLLGLALLVAFVGILNAMLMSVTERFREIGTMKCLGALDSFIIKLFLIESLFQGIVGTLLGILLGFVLSVAAILWTYGGYAWMNVPVGDILWSMLICLLVGVGLTVAGAVYPAWQAARMQPIEAMRVEA